MGQEIAAPLNDIATEAKSLREQYIGDDDMRYSPQPMVERVSPALVGSELGPEDSVVGFALFALPVDVEPVTMEWCPTSNCDELVLQSQITFID